MSSTVFLEHGMQEQPARLHHPPLAESTTQPVVASPAMHRVIEYARKVGQTSAAVLITGETGSGKEVVARAVHENSLRCAKPLVDLNCGAIPEHLLESELFGYERGAFSGADRQKPGLFELAHGGTLFLDEIGEADMKTQVKLLRVLDGAPYYRLGGVRKIAVDVRIIAATNANLLESVKQGRFRSDLYYRLGQVQIGVPPLRERSEDIAALALHFLRQHDRRFSILPAAMALLQNYGWPGNVRELRNAITSAALHAGGSLIAPQDLPAHIRAEAEAGDGEPESPLALEAVEQRVIFEALRKAGGRQDKAAELLGISRRTLIRRLKSYRLRQAGGGSLRGALLGGAMELEVAV